MKRFTISVLCTLLFSMVTFAQYKVTESSERRMPSWVGSVEHGYLCVSGTGSSLEDARSAALAELKSQIAESVAVLVISDTRYQSSSTESNGMSQFSQNMESDIRTKSAKLPFINEISLSKAKGYYWEERYFKDTRATEYLYAIRYPFSDLDLKMLVAEYQEHEKRLNEQLAKFELMLEQMTSIEDINRTISDLKAFQAEFMTEDPRFEKVNFLIHEYKHLFDAISIAAVQTQKGVIACVLMLQDREISTRQRPTLKSNCAAKMSASFEGNTILIKYDDFPCYEEDENYIEVRISTGTSKTIYEKIYIKNNVNISLTGVVTDEQGNPVPYAKITLIPGGKQAVTGRNGMYQFNDVNPGNYEVQALKPHFQTVSNYTYISGSETVRCDLVTRRVSEPQIAGNDPNFSAPLADQPAPKQNLNPASVVRNGLLAYFRFNNTGADEMGSGVNAQLINGAKYSSESADGTQSIQLSAVNESLVSIPKPMFQNPYVNFSVSFWVLGASDGHYFTSVGGSDTPRLIMDKNKFRVIYRYQNEGDSFSHAEIPYEWTHVTITSSAKQNEYVQCLYINGELVDMLNGWVRPFDDPSKFIIGGRGADKLGNNAINMNVDNFRIYTRPINGDEVKLIYQAEGGR